MPERTTPRRRSAEERRRQILDAALGLFARKGYSGTTTKEIAQQIGITEGLIFHYFGSKAELLVETAKQRSALLVEVRALLREADGLAAAETMPRIARGWVELVHRQGDLVVMLVSEAHAHHEVGAAFRTLFDEIRDALARYLDGRVAAGELRASLSTEVAAASFLSSLLMFFYTRRHLDDAAWAEAAGPFTRDLLDTWFEGAAARRNPA
ncbi:MAG: TetR/AcrR family transcriptional regulator [Trueperaceae bacterium]|nr:TetR/AcrR family transcriptional regulator [Trueperaceae bacterium]